MKKTNLDQAHFETLALHSGQEVDADTLSRSLPIYRTSSYLFKDADHASNLFALKEQGYIYTRMGNPTQEVLEKRISALEGGAAALALSSGATAIYYSIINICSNGDEVVAASNLYGGTYTMFKDILPQFGINAKFVNIRDINSFERAINDKTKAIFIETIGNPLLDVADIAEISKVAKKFELPLIVDSTFTTPYLLRPIEYGADIVVHSLTKWIGGHGTAIGGVVVDSGKFNWRNKKFKLFNEPDESYHGLRYAWDLGDMNSIAFTVRMRLVPLRNLGACISPDNAWFFLQGLETLSLRMERHSYNAAKVAQFLENSDKVKWVRYPGLECDSCHSVAKKYLKNGYGGMVVFGIKGGKEAGKIFIENLNIFSHLANVGDAKSLAIHPASTTHSQLSEKDMELGGLTEDLIRLSIGIENIEDIIKDLENALSKV
ncbi:MAG TPA: aminotransferase class I/II-fold pyridoxal phosphate-dependent enzyme [Spirochaetota bacterium]|nr:MAG: Methionine gamma-lyase [Spirochaetes bacterium ADurb.Bin133]HNZ25803.1 aminotransferase class I/II-fold pyridoxal phosphate-dependent enzyme [Spirochaetota bacterium]HPY88399.1 aminotransferase class I/II-fold pyridoxal phosphate-dependent enzyme [Spirochaetota bacterium]